MKTIAPDSSLHFQSCLKIVHFFIHKIRQQLPVFVNQRPILFSVTNGRYTVLEVRRIGNFFLDCFPEHIFQRAHIGSDSKIEQQIALFVRIIELHSEPVTQGDARKTVGNGAAE